jgi:tRNA(Phe) wybutosine-synthesizing methylase Tyw3
VHKTQRIAIKEADIDEKIVPVILWLNSFHSVNTFFCCQGKGGKVPQEPYVLFSCYEQEELMEILKVLRNHPHRVRLEIDWLVERLPMRYKLVFQDPKALKCFIAWECL